MLRVTLCGTTYEHHNIHNPFSVISVTGLVRDGRMALMSVLNEFRVSITTQYVARCRYHVHCCQQLRALTTASHNPWTPPPFVNLARLALADEIIFIHTDGTIICASTTHAEMCTWFPEKLRHSLVCFSAADWIRVWNFGHQWKHVSQFISHVESLLWQKCSCAANPQLWCIRCFLLTNTYNCAVQCGTPKSRRAAIC